MKSFTLGVLSLLLVSILTNVIWNHTTGDTLAHKISWFIQDSILQGNYILNPLNGKCSNQNIEKLNITLANYFECDKFQRLININ